MKSSASGNQIEGEDVDPKNLDNLVLAVVYCAYRQYLSTPYEARDKTIRITEDFQRAWHLANIIDNPACEDECCFCTRDGFRCCKCGN